MNPPIIDINLCSGGFIFCLEDINDMNKIISLIILYNKY